MLDEKFFEKIKRYNHVQSLTAAVYARFSTGMQRSESIDAQLRYMYEFANLYNVTIVNKYIDEAKTARWDDREAFKQMVEDSKKRHWQIVFVHKLDRFSRNRWDSLYYRQILRTRGVWIISVSEPMDDSPESLIIESILEAMAEYYSLNLARETMKGLTQNALEGKHCGGTPIA